MGFGNQTYKIRPCVVCGDIFQPSHHYQKTCSNICRLKRCVIDHSDPTKCWIFNSKSKANKKFNYGIIWVGGTKKTMPAHRFSYETFIGPIKEGYFICHTCDTPACVNPAHLAQGTAKDNTYDMLSKSRGAIVKGSKVGSAKLNESQVEEIFKSSPNYTFLAHKFNVSRRAIRDIFIGNTWNQITGLPKRNCKYTKTTELLGKSPFSYSGI